jgi:ribose-phosphate pyrophosphokinase
MVCPVFSPITPEIIFAAPDMGAAKRTRIYANFWHKEMVICHKYRKEANQIAEMTVIGEVDGKDIIIVDKMAN